MKFNYLLGALCLSTFVFSSCGGDDPVPTPNEPTVIKKSLEVVTQNEGTEDNMFPDYDKWVYVNLETGDTAIRKDVSAKEWRTYSDDGEKTDRFGKYKITKTVEAGKDNAPAKWHLAFHIYDIKTNGGEAYMSDTTDIETIKTLPEKVKWASDTKAYLICDMRGMMAKPAVLGYMLNYVNMGLYYWMQKVKGQMGVYELTMSKSDPKKTPVFIVKFKDGSYALIQFTDLKDKTGKRKTATFTYKFVKNSK